MRKINRQTLIKIYAFFVFMFFAAPIVALAALTITTNPATNITQNGATLNATVAVFGQDASVKFRYSTSPGNNSCQGLTNYTETSSTQYNYAGGSNGGTFSLNIPITGLIQGTVYYFCALDVGNGVYGNLLNFQTLGNPPPVGGGGSNATISVSNVTQNSATLLASNIMSPAGPNGPSETVYFKYSTIAPPSGVGGCSVMQNAQTSQTASAGPNNSWSVSIPVSGLTAGTTYYYCLAIVPNMNIGNPLIFSDVATFQTLQAGGGNNSGGNQSGGSIGTVETRPAGVDVDTGDTNVTLNGFLHSDGGKTVYGYFRYTQVTFQPPLFCNEIYGSNMVGVTATSPNKDGRVSTGTAFSAGVKNLKPDTIYSYCAVVSNKAFDVNGSKATDIKYGQVRTFKTLPCKTCPHTSVQTIPAVVTGPTSAVFKGSYSSTKNVTTYFQYRLAAIKGVWNNAPGSFKDHSPYTYNNFSFNMTGLTPATAYQFRALARTYNPEENFEGEILSFTTPKTKLNIIITDPNDGDDPGFTDPQSCPNGYTGTWPKCIPYCPPNDVSCTVDQAPQCPNGYTGQYPNCVQSPKCPTGMVGTFPNCYFTIMKCPAGYTGQQPNCIPPPAPIVTLTNTASPIQPGEYSGITWSSVYATSCNNGGQTSGSMKVGPLFKTKTYKVTCTGLGGSGSATTTIYVGDDAGGSGDTPDIPDLPPLDIPPFLPPNYSLDLPFLPPIDLDGDGLPGASDWDLDGDGLPNLLDIDIDNDNIPNGQDPDDDGDGIPDTLDPTPYGYGNQNDVDGDGIINGNDWDLDGDGIPNILDPDLDGDGTLNPIDLDDDGDGIPDGTDTTPNGPGTLGDIDGDGIPNGSDPDIDGDGVLNIFDNDIDGDGIPNIFDLDDDGDGIPDGSDTTPNGPGTLGDIDGDGIPNGSDPDVDGDGIPNGSDPDIDGDGIPNGSDWDIDGDNILNGADTDIDGDGLPNTTDTDDDGDGVLDVIDSTPSGTGNTGTVLSGPNTNIFNGIPGSGVWSSTGGGSGIWAGTLPNSPNGWFSGNLNGPNGPGTWSGNCFNGVCTGTWTDGNGSTIPGISSGPVSGTFGPGVLNTSISTGTWSGGNGNGNWTGVWSNDTITTGTWSGGNALAPITDTFTNTNNPNNFVMNGLLGTGNWSTGTNGTSGTWSGVFPNQPDGPVSGTWSDGNGNSGTFTGNCQSGVCTGTFVVTNGNGLNPNTTGGLIGSLGTGTGNVVGLWSGSNPVIPSTWNGLNLGSGNWQGNGKEGTWSGIAPGQPDGPVSGTFSGPNGTGTWTGTCLNGVCTGTWSGGNGNGPLFGNWNGTNGNGEEIFNGLSGTGTWTSNENGTGGTWSGIAPGQPNGPVTGTWGGTKPSDIDGDGIPNIFDNDIDGDGIPNSTDTDDDGDGIPDVSDSTPSGLGSLSDIDGDGVANNTDFDVDGDGIPNALDNDIDGDGIPNSTDTDDDGDGIPDVSDSTPNGVGTPNDLDGDGIPNSTDTDDDGDGVPDVSDPNPNGGQGPNTFTGVCVNGVCTGTWTGSGMPPNSSGTWTGSKGKKDNIWNGLTGEGVWTGKGKNGTWNGSATGNDGLGILKVGSKVKPNWDAIVRKTEGVETVFIRQIVNNPDFAKRYGWQENQNILLFAYNLAHYFGINFGYVDPKTLKEVRVVPADVAAYQFWQNGNTLLVYEVFKDQVRSIKSFSNKLKDKYTYEYYFTKKAR